MDRDLLENVAVAGTKAIGELILPAVDDFLTRREIAALLERIGACVMASLECYATFAAAPAEGQAPAKAAPTAQ